MTNDGTDHVYTWDADGHPVTLDSDNLVYDALGREVEVFKGGAYTEFVFGPTGKLALMSGQTQTKAFVPLPGGTQVKYAGNTISTYRLPDWLGSLRVGSNPNRTYSWGVAFAPFGEMYAQSGGPAWSFTGEEGTADTVSDEYDFLARKLHSAQGRWISPDPAGLGAVVPSNPQTWNRYAYVGNDPLIVTDPLGLFQDAVSPSGGICIEGPSCAWGAFAGSTYYVNGMEVPAAVAERLAAMGGGEGEVAAFCPGNNCHNIRLDENGLWDELIGVQSRTALTPTGGSTYRTWSPMWIDYVPPMTQLAFTSTLTFHTGPVTPQISAVHPPDPRLKWQFANMACLNGAVNSNNQFGDANNATPPTDSVAPVNNPTINFTSQPQGAEPWEDVKNEGTKPLQGEGPTGIAPITPQAMVGISYRNCMSAHGY